jgi:hypothetical protein
MNNLGRIILPTEVVKWLSQKYEDDYQYDRLGKMTEKASI